MSSKRQRALSHITAIVAITGFTTSECIGVYVENSISYENFKKAVEKGIILFNSNKEKQPTLAK